MYNSKQQTEYLDDLRRLAEQGDAEAQNELGSLYRTKEFLHYKEAFRWLLKAAEQGHADAQNATGEMLREGKKILRNFKEAFKWFSLAAKQGNAAACFNLGKAYCYGEGCKGDTNQALHWFQKAVAQGEWEALYPMGMLYLNKQGRTIADEEKAEECLRKYSEYENECYPYIINEYKWLRIDKVYDWIQRAAEQGCNRIAVDAQYQLGVFYEKGILGRRNMPEAIEWYRKSAMAGNKNAQEALNRLNNQMQVVIKQEEYFLQLVEVEQEELIYNPEWKKCDIVFSYGENKYTISIKHSDCPISIFYDYAMFHLLMRFAELIADNDGDWILYVEKATNYMLELPIKKKGNELGFFYTCIANLYKRERNDVWAKWFFEQAEIYNQLSEGKLLEGAKAWAKVMPKDAVLDFCLYVSRYVTEQGCFGDDDFYRGWLREHYELMEYALSTAMESLTKNENISISLQLLISFLNAVYLKRTRRFVLAESLFKECLLLFQSGDSKCHISSDVIYALLGECYLHEQNEVCAKKSFQKIVNKASPFGRYVQNKISAEELNEICYKKITAYCCHENMTTRDLKIVIDIFFASPEVYDEEAFCNSGRD